MPILCMLQIDKFKFVGLVVRKLSSNIIEYCHLGGGEKSPPLFLFISFRSVGPKVLRGKEEEWKKR